MQFWDVLDSEFNSGTNLELFLGQPLFFSHNSYFPDLCDRLQEPQDLRKLMRQNAFDESEDNNKTYTGESCTKTPCLTTPPSSLAVMKSTLDDNMTPPPVGIQTVLCQFKEYFFVFDKLFW